MAAYEIATGGASIERRRAYEAAALFWGKATLWVPLNGSSESRSAEQVYFSTMALNLLVPFHAQPHRIVMGGHYRKGRGRRYVSYKHELLMVWVNWRRAKKLHRKGLVDVLTFGPPKPIPTT